MASDEEVRPLPKFGECDVNDQASVEGFSTIFSRARYERLMRRHDNKAGQSRSAVRKWFCWG